MKQEEVIRDVYTLLAERQAQIDDETLRESDITIRRIMERVGISENQARRLAVEVLEPMVEKGTYRKVTCLNPRGGGKLVAYRLVKNAEAG